MIIGQPHKIADFSPFSPEELAQLRTTLDTLLGDGAPPNTPIGVDIGVLARLFTTIDALRAVTARTITIPGLFGDAGDADKDADAGDAE